MVQRLFSEADLRSAEFALQVARYEKEAAQAALKYSAGQKQGRAAEKVKIESPVKGRILKILRETSPVRFTPSLVKTKQSSSGRRTTRSKPSLVTWSPI